MTSSESATPAPPAPPPGAPPPPPVPAASLTHLTKRYGSLTAVRDLTLGIPKGSLFALVGPNGAGKTTAFSVLATLLLPTAGSAKVMDHDAVHDARRVRDVLGYMPDQLGVYDNMLVEEYLEFFASAYHVPRQDRPAVVDGLLELVDLTVKKRSAVDSLSRGMKQRLSLARALVHDPDVLILDEPASGLDPRARVELRELLLELSRMGKTIIISSHILAELEQIATHVAILEAGRLLAVGAPSTILDQLGAGRQLQVTFAGGTTETFSVATEAEQQALLERLVSERDVIEFTRVGGGLEDLFMSLTEGIVQ